MLEIVPLMLGPFQTNTYLIADGKSGQAVVVDPAEKAPVIQQEAQRRGWKIGQLWITHAHFDHVGGVTRLRNLLQPPPEAAMHPADLPLWRNQGGAPFFGLHMDTGPEPTLALAHGQILHVGSHNFEVRHTPGHTPGHVIFYCANEKVALCGDLIFQGGIGRTDMPGSDFATLIASIRSQVLTLPDETRLLCGHGDETTVAAERLDNPFI